MLIVEGFDRDRVDIFERLNGSFALAIYDSYANLLYIARDRFGIEPLYYYFDGRSLIFSSDIRGVVKSKIINPELSYQGLYEYIHFSTTLGRSTLYRGVERLESGFFIEFNMDSREINISPYRLSYTAPKIREPVEVAVKRVRGLLKRSIASHIESSSSIKVLLRWWSVIKGNIG